MAPIVELDIHRGRDRGSAVSVDRGHFLLFLPLAVKKGRDPTPSKIHLPIHTHGNDENLLLVRNLESYIKYYNNKHRVNMILISVKHITKLWEEKRKEEYMVLDLKQNATTCRIFVTLLDLMQYPQQYL
ncbi:uncharacterized protein LOC107821275 isoform X2 [Nicotiana tabacum]|uniref:Uncharacterized protein LOC107821275 isoform X2 n=3 Tax=Nicotiana tabacum TaxID=4097 RepID=A0AC58TY12_TOBAC